MTREWRESDKLLSFRKPYVQPVFEDTPHQENAENTRYAIHHFSKPAKLRRYENPLGYNELTGRADRGPHTLYDILIEIQPVGGAENTRELDEGERIENSYEFWFDPHHPDHAVPIYLRQSDSRFISGDGVDSNISGHSDIIQYMGENYIIRRIDNWGSSSHEEEHGQSTGYQYGYLYLWRDHHHERNRTIENDSFQY